MKRAAVALLLILAGCQTPAPPIAAVYDCPRPDDDALKLAEPLPDIPPLPADADGQIKALWAALARDDGQYATLAGRQKVLVTHGQKFCHW